MSVLADAIAKAKGDAAAVEERARVIRQQAASGKIEVSITAGGTELKFTFRKPTAREWQDYEGARMNFGTAIASGTATRSITREMYEASEELCARLVNSHTAQQLQDLNDEHMGIFLPLADQIADAVDLLRSGAGKASPPPGGA